MTLKSTFFFPYETAKIEKDVCISLLKSIYRLFVTNKLLASNDWSQSNLHFLDLCEEPRTQVQMKDVGFSPPAASSKTNMIFLQRDQSHILQVSVFFEGNVLRKPKREELDI